MADARILIVEDDGITGRYVQGCLRGHGYDATTVVTSGREALRKAAALEPDVLVVDIRLREDDMDGVETVRRLRERSDVPVIYLTGCSDDATRRRAGATSPQSYLVKPFVRRELVSAIEDALRHRGRSGEGQSYAGADESPYRAIVESQVEMVCRFGVDGALTYVNAACCQAFERSAEDLLGTSYWSLVAPPDREAVRRRVAALSRHRPAEVHENRALALSPMASAAGLRASPALCWQQWSIRALLDPAGRIVGYQAVGRDVTERRQREMDLDQRVAELREALAGQRPIQGLVPICASCKRIRNAAEEWEILEAFLRDHYAIEFTHGLCPACMERLYPGYADEGDEALAAGTEAEPS